MSRHLLITSSPHHSRALSESRTKMTGIDCAPVNSLSLQAGGRPAASAATQLEPGLAMTRARVYLCGLNRAREGGLKPIFFFS